MKRIKWKHPYVQRKTFSIVFGRVFVSKKDVFAI